MPRIALLTTDSVPNLGGIANYLDNLITSTLSKINWSVYSTISAGRFDDLSLPYAMNRIPESRRLGLRNGDNFPLTRKLNTLIWRLNKPREGLELIKQIQKEFHPDLIAIGRWTEQSHFWCRACQHFQIPYIVFAYGLELVEPLPRNHTIWRRRDICLAKQVISISQGTTEVLKNLNVQEEHIIFVPPGIDSEKLTPLSENEQQQILFELNLDRRRFILGLGKLIQRKGFDLAIRSFAEIASRFPDILLVIAGEDGIERENLKKMISEMRLKERIRLFVEINEIEKRALFQGCEFFVMPNRPVSGDMEGFGIVFLEANVFSKAIIGGNNGGVPDAVADGETGLLVDTSKSYQPLTEAMIKLLENPMLSKQLGKRGRERALKNFNWKQIELKFLDCVL